MYERDFLLMKSRMLYEFHRKQNAKQPGSVHATYLLTGTRRKQTQAHPNGVHSQEDGEDIVMQSSPPLPSSSAQRPDDEPAEEPITVHSVLLVKEEHLEQARATFETIASIHVYSLAAKGLGDIQTLTECNRKIAVDYASEDPLKAWKQYGTIQNPMAKRRAQKTAPPPPPAAAPAAKAAEAKPKPAVKSATLEKQASKDSQDEKPTKVKAEPAKAATVPQRQKPDLFKSFAKGKVKPKKEDSQNSAEASSALPPKEEATPDFSDEDEAEGDAEADAEADAVVEQAETVPEGKTKKDREAELKAMMEQEDEEMEDVAEGTEPEVDAAIDKEESQPAEEPKESVTIENGRRRGRRRVMKKKTVKDEDGYLGALPAIAPPK